MNIITWNNFVKRKNSTKQPADADGTSRTVRLKENTSHEAPVFILNTPMSDVTYVKAFDHYYFVADTVNINAAQCEIHCVQDTLATFKTNIGSYTAFVERSSHTYDAEIEDHLLSNTPELTNIAYAQTNMGFDSNGFYTVPVTSKDGIRIYCFNTLADIANFYNGIHYKKADGTLISVTELDNLITSIGLGALNITDYMGAAMWFPFSYNAWKEAVNTVSAGFLSLDLSGYYIVTQNYIELNAQLVMPTNAYSDFRARISPFSIYNVYFPGVGTIQLDAAHAAEGDVYVAMGVDFMSGAISYRLYHSGHTTESFASFNGQIGAPLSMSKAGSTLFTTLSTGTAGLAETIGGIASASPELIGRGVNNIVNNIRSIRSGMPSINGGSGNRGAMTAVPYVVTCVSNCGSKEFPAAVAGRPLYQNVQLSTIPGFIKCGGASVPLNARDNDRTEINNYLNSGFYFE